MQTHVCKVVLVLAGGTHINIIILYTTARKSANCVLRDDGCFADIQKE